MVDHRVDIKEILNKVSDNFELLYKKIDSEQLKKIGAEGNPKIFGQILKINLLYFLFYLCCSDGVITRQKAEYINFMFDCSLSQRRIKQIVEDKKI